MTDRHADRLQIGGRAISWSRPAASPRAVVLLLLAAAGLFYLSLPSLCKSHQLHEAELHARGLWRAPRLGVDAFIARHVRSNSSWEVLLVQVGASSGEASVGEEGWAGSNGLADVSDFKIHQITAITRCHHTGAPEPERAQRKRDPSKGAWCVVGGFVVYGEDPLDAVQREVEEETHLVVDMAVRFSG